MTVLRQKMIEDMQLHGFAERTQDSYLRAVRQLATYFNKPPDQISEEELRQYFLYLKNVKKASRSTITLALCGIKFFYERTLQRQWATLALLRPPQEKKLPVVLSVEEVRQILARVRRWRYRVCLSTIYACGLRLAVVFRGVNTNGKNFCANDPTSSVVACSEDGLTFTEAGLDPNRVSVVNPFAAQLPDGRWRLYDVDENGGVMTSRSSTDGIRFA